MTSEKKIKLFVEKLINMSDTGEIKWSYTRWSYTRAGNVRHPKYCYATNLKVNDELYRTRLVYEKDDENNAENLTLTICIPEHIKITVDLNDLQKLLIAVKNSFKMPEKIEAWLDCFLKKSF